MNNFNADVKKCAETIEKLQVILTDMQSTSPEQFYQAVADCEGVFLRTTTELNTLFYWYMTQVVLRQRKGMDNDGR